MYLTFPNGGENGVRYDFDKPVNIHSFLATFSCQGNCGSSLVLLDIDGNMFSLNTTNTVGRNNQNIIKFPEEYKNIVTVSFSNSAGWAKDLYEFNVYGYSAEPPEKPTGIKAIRNGKQIEVSWTANKDSVIGYNVYLNGRKINSTPVKSIKYQFESGAGTNNKIEVTAINEGLFESPKSESVTVRVPSEVTNLRETHTHDYVSLTWINPSDSYFEKVRVYRDGKLIAEGKFASFTDNDVDPVSSYDYKVVVVETGGEVSEGVSIEATTDQDPDYRPPAPAPPDHVDHEDGKDEEGRDFILITWSESEFAVKYKIFVDDQLVYTAPAGTNQYKYYPPAKKPHYNIVVIAVDEEGNESPPATNPTEWDKAKGDNIPNLKDIIKTAFEFVGIFGGLILTSLIIIFLPWIIRFIYLVLKVAKKLNIKF